MDLDSGLQSCCFQAPGLWPFVTAAQETHTSSESESEFYKIPRVTQCTLQLEKRWSPGAWNPGCLWAEQGLVLNSVLITVPLLRVGN